MTFWTSPTRWTEEERSKATYIALRAMRLDRDPKADVMAYMGMTAEDAAVAVTRAKIQHCNDGRRPPVRHGRILRMTA